MKKISPDARRRLYDLGIALIVVAAVYGILNEEEAAAWSLVLAPLFGLARGNVQ